MQDTAWIHNLIFKEFIMGLAHSTNGKASTAYLFMCQYKAIWKAEAPAEE
jgi:hypothetical protein